MQTLDMAFEVTCLGKGAVAILTGVGSVAIMLSEVVTEVA